jgi:hypothetical protein
MQEPHENHHFGPVGVMVALGALALLAASWDLGLQATGAFLLAVLGAVAIGLTLSCMDTQNASRHLWIWSLTIPLPCLVFAESLRHADMLLPRATALSLAWFYFLLVGSLLVRAMRQRS